MTKFLNDKRTNSALNNKMFKRLNHLTNHLYEVELVRPEIEHRESIFVGFKFYKMLSRDCWNFFAISKSSVTLTSMKNLKWTPISLLCSVRRKLGRRYSPRKTGRVDCNALDGLHRHIHCQRNRQLLPRMCCYAHKKHDNIELGLFEEEF